MLRYAQLDIFALRALQNSASLVSGAFAVKFDIAPLAIGFDMIFA